MSESSYRVYQKKENNENKASMLNEELLGTEIVMPMININDEKEKINGDSGCGFFHTESDCVKLCQENIPFSFFFSSFFFPFFS